MNDDEDEFEYEEYGEEASGGVIVPGSFSAWKPSWLDYVAIAAHTAGQVLGGLAHGALLVAQETQAAANRRRIDEEEAKGRRLLADDLASLERGEVS